MSSPAYSVRTRERVLSLSEPRIMGILNITPDSFFDGGRYGSIELQLQRVGTMIDQGASIIDIGAMSSRPGAELVSIEEEKSRLLPSLEAIRATFPDVWISVDTYRYELVQAALDAGADIINDITGGRDQRVINLCADHRMGYIAMHMQGTPDTMQRDPSYDQIVVDLIDFFADRLHHCREHGLWDVIIDPGFGFGKTIEQNYELLDHIDAFHILQCPILVGISRKSMIYKVLQQGPEDALLGTAALHLSALRSGAHILRVHDVPAARDMIRLAEYFS